MAHEEEEAREHGKEANSKNKNVIRILFPDAAGARRSC